MPKQLSRRKFLKLSSATLAVALSPSPKRWMPHPAELAPDTIQDTSEPIGLMGRALAGGVTVYDKAEPGAQRLAYYRRDESFIINGEVRAPGLNRYNDLWYETEEGYVFSAWVQPMLQYLPQPTYFDLGEWGLWGEICRAHTSARFTPHPAAAEKYRYYYGTTYHVIGVQRDEEGNDWYQLFDELPPTTSYWALAQDVRICPRSEMAPISPFVGDKRIEVDLGQQRVTCFENGQVVFSCGCASGAAFTMADGSIADFGTPRGEYNVLLKQASRHMVGEDENSPDYFDLPGVPWDTFFDLEGRAIHGTYWHNDYGVPRSHGCVNVSIDAARWIYRWTHPIGAYADDYIQSNWRVGTPIIMF